MYQRNRVLLFVTIITVVCSMPPSFAEQIGKTEAGALPNKQPAGAEGLNLKQLEQGLGELRQTLLKHQESITLQERQLENQSKVIAVQKRVLEQQNQELQYLRNQILSQDRLQTQRAAGIHDSRRVADAGLDTDTQQKLKKGSDSATIQGTGTRQGQWVSQAPNEQQYESVENTKTSETAKGADSKSQKGERPEVAAIPEIGGVLTPRGRLMLEPALQLSNSSFNRFTFLGVEIVDAFLVGLIQAEDTSRDLISPQLTARYGITNRLEAEVKIPYVYRSDEISGTIPQIRDADGVAATVDRDFDGNGLGDIELALHYQVNRGLDGWPFFIGNLRWKSTTGEGPFDVDRDVFGLEDESPTGSGFYSLEPSMTILYPTDPAVFFANIGYLINFEKDVDKTFIQTVESSGDIVTQTFGDVDPGDALRVSFGMGYALNERSSLTLGYKHDFIFETDFEINGTTISSNDLDVGSLLLGWGFAVTPRANVNLNLELGITQDAPDVLVTLRVPFTAYEF